MALDGRLCLALRPPAYRERLEYWKNHPDTNELDEIVNNVTKVALDSKSNSNDMFGRDEQDTNDAEDEDDDDDDGDETSENEIKYFRDELQSDREKKESESDDDE
jgi:hypothetical protein